VSAEQRSSSSQSASTLRQPAIGSKAQPVTGSQTSSVQASPSPWRRQRAVVTHAGADVAGLGAVRRRGCHWALLLQRVGIPGCTHPLAPSSQLSAVHMMPSSQLRRRPGSQVPVPALQSSTPLQKWPSLAHHGRALHVPPPWTSPVVHRLPSLQDAVLLVWPQGPAPVSQVSSVHTWPSSQFCGDPPTQFPPAQVSTSVQACCASLHDAVLLS
jgi:hypothetical protein